MAARKKAPIHYLIWGINSVSFFKKEVFINNAICDDE
jgi:hypothetical protein